MTPIDIVLPLLRRMKWRTYRWKSFQSRRAPIVWSRTPLVFNEYSFPSIFTTPSKSPNCSKWVWWWLKYEPKNSQSEAMISCLMYSFKEWNYLFKLSKYFLDQDSSAIASLIEAGLKSVEKLNVGRFERHTTDIWTSTSFLNESSITSFPLYSRRYSFSGMIGLIWRPATV